MGDDTGATDDTGASDDTGAADDTTEDTAAGNLCQCRETVDDEWTEYCSDGACASDDGGDGGEGGDDDGGSTLTGDEPNTEAGSALQVSAVFAVFALLW